jgi:hypothetical protein
VSTDGRFWVSTEDLGAYATEHIGSRDIFHWNANLQVNGGLLLTGDRQWSKNPVNPAAKHPSEFWYFNFREGRTRAGFEDLLEGDTMDALCVRPATAADEALPTGAPAPAQTARLTSSPVLARTGLGRGGAHVLQGDILFVARPALQGMLPSRIRLEVPAQQHTLRKISKSLLARAVFSSRIGVFSANRAAELTEELVPALLG